ncbi:YkgJ family cysteine cluster protein [Paraburkholderia sp. MM6662-R1]|uniref:YkgJ family cysteine cluster protein n=1 Tax=Paraburkholderia sp. MM6662-R1 TaxID=2991066 RepID=UPI003D1F7332
MSHAAATIFGTTQPQPQQPRKLIPLADADRVAAARNAQLAAEKIRPRIPGWNVRILKLINGTEPVRARLRGLYVIADEMTAAAAPYAACKRGCSSCCHMATMVSEPEADVIAHAIGVKARKPKTWPFFDPRSGIERPALTGFVESFHGGIKPCPFLRNNACSIYEHRPLACRVHLNMAASAESCKMDAPRETAMLDLRKLDEAYALIGRSARMTDIREYFPNGLRK